MGLRVLDLFSGIGGFSLAAHWAGMETVAFCESAEYPRSVLANRFPGIPIYKDVTKLCRRAYDCTSTNDDSGSLHCPRCDAEFGDCECIGTDEFTDTHGFPDGIVGGVPCQPASLVGKRRGTSDERWLWPDTLRIVRELRPGFCVLENPEALLSLEKGGAFRGILSAFASLGYDVQWHIVPASALGAGHRRKRIWILATDADCSGFSRHARNGKAVRDAKTDRHFAESDLRTREIASPLWYHQSGIQPVVNGLSRRLAEQQLTAVGNSLVPQVAAIWLRAIAQMHQERAA